MYFLYSKPLSCENITSKKKVDWNWFLPMQVPANLIFNQLFLYCLCSKNKRYVRAQMCALYVFLYFMANTFWESTFKCSKSISWKMQPFQNNGGLPEHMKSFNRTNARVFLFLVQFPWSIPKVKAFSQISVIKTKKKFKKPKL